MKFAPNRLYIEAYNKCPNCGLLLYEKPAGGVADAVLSQGKLYCSQWCVDWEADRRARRQAETQSTL
jgi:hypothetical protein